VKHQSGARADVVSGTPSGLPDLLHLLVDIRGYALPVVTANTMNDASAKILRVVLSIIEAGEIAEYQSSAYQ
jgi:hypothetical protein